MSWGSDLLGFEKFNLSDIWKKIKKHPGQLLTGVDPLSTKLWNGILHRKDEPLVDQMGGAYGGSMLSAFGNNDGGVYKRAREAGIDTGAGENMHDLAHVVSAVFGGQGLAGIGGGSAGGADLGVFSNGGVNGLQGVGGGNAGALANSGAIQGGAGMGGAAEGGATNWMDMAKDMGGNMQQPQQSLAQSPEGRSRELELERQKKEREEEEKRKLMAAVIRQQSGNYSPA